MSKNERQKTNAHLNYTPQAVAGLERRTPPCHTSKYERLIPEYEWIDKQIS